MPGRSTSEGTIHIRIASEEDLTRALLETGRLVSEIGFDAAATSHINTAVSELGRNILKYAGAGELTLELVTEDHHSGVRATIHDNGPGIEDLDRAMSSVTYGLSLPGNLSIRRRRQKKFGRSRRGRFDMPASKRRIVASDVTITSNGAVVIQARRFR